MSTMNKWLIAAGILIVTGVLICLAALKFLNFNFKEIRLYFVLLDQKSSNNTRYEQTKI